ncbi:MAG TPA: pitrilysin family protein [Vicinamibacterales bacterium]|nr:pitrilysin family protein [Vicinamibacterales bacterium]
MTFPPVSRSLMPNGLGVWSIVQAPVPVVSCALVVNRGTAGDPQDRPGLASFVASLAIESAGDRDSIALADALARIGAHLDVQPSTDVTVISVQTLTRHLPAALDLMADIVRRPQFAAGDFARVRELRLSRLRQASRVASTIADRALIAGVYGDHPYGHGALGTSRAVAAITIDQVRDWWAQAWSPAGATFVAAGDIDAKTLEREVARTFGDWRATSAAAETPPPRADAAARRLLAVHRPGSAQAEVRVGQLGPRRDTPDYHALVTVNALLGGQFTSRINRNLREQRAITYGARSAFDMRRAGGLFSCDTSVQSDSAAIAASEILRELGEVRIPGAVSADELARAQAGLTRGYVRHFETVGQLTRALVDLATYRLPDDTFDRFVPRISALTTDDIVSAAAATMRPDDCTVVVVADLDRHRDALDALGRDVAVTSVEF